MDVMHFWRYAMKEETKLLVVYQWILWFPKVPTYIQNDINMLKKHFNLTECQFNFRSIIKLIREVRKTDVVFIWFAGFHALTVLFITRIFKKPIVIVTGGYDVTELKEIKYGMMQNPISKMLVKYILKRADKILSVSEFNKKEAEKYIGINNSEVIFNCVNTDYFKPKGKKENIVISVGLVSDNTIKRKGLDIFVKAAEKIPKITFYMVGSQEKNAVKYLKSIAAPNVKFTGFVSKEDLLTFYQRAKVYCQLSMHEAFGVSVGEAMSCECVPVVSDKGALSEVVGDTGYVTPYGDLDKIAEAIKKALKDEKNGKLARKRIIENYTSEIREKKLLKVINKVLNIK